MTDAAACGTSTTAAARQHYFFRVDASSLMGTGHLMRCLTLAERLQHRQGEAHFLCRNLPPVLEAQILAAGHVLHRLPPATRPIGPEEGPAHRDWLGSSWQEDAEQTIALIQACGKARALIIDHYAIDRRWELMVRPFVPAIAVIDDLADRSHECDLLLDQNYFPDPAARYAGLLPAGTRTLFGPAHALLRREFLDPAQRPRERDGRVQCVLIFYGGADGDNLTGRTLDALAPRLGCGLEIDIVVGAINPHVGSLRSRTAGLTDVRLHVQADNMAELMNQADLAFGACGTATWERCQLGLPTIAVILAENQRASTLALETAGVVLNLGDACNLTSSALIAAFDALATSPERLRRMSLAARALMQSEDARIEDILTYGLPFMFNGLQLRPARPGDAGALLEWRNHPDVRKSSRNQDPIAQEQHLRWLQAVLDAPDRHLLIGYRGNHPVGVLRLDESGDQGEISIYLTPDSHGQGNGSALLQALEAWVRVTRHQINRLVAVVLDDNTASRRLFLKNAYSPLTTHYEKRITR